MVIVSVVGGPQGAWLQALQLLFMSQTVWLESNLEGPSSGCWPDFYVGVCRNQRTLPTSLLKSFGFPTLSVVILIPDGIVSNTELD